MPVTLNGERKSGTGTSAGTTITFSPASNCTAGNTIYLCFLVVGAAGATAVSDGTNVWTGDMLLTSGGRCISVWASYQATGLTTSSVVTVTMPTTVGYAYWLEEFNGNYSAVDVQATSTGSNVTSLPTGTTAATATADELALAVYSTNTPAGTITKNASYTNFTTGEQTAPSTQDGLFSYRILSATGTQNADGTDSSMVNSLNGVVTYKAVATVTIPPLPLYVDTAVMQSTSR
jgi:hypothetical protein